MRHAFWSLCLLAAGALPAFSAGAPQAAWNWESWRHLPVLDGGRYKPLDTLAWETMRTLSNRVSFTDPETHERLDATAAYLALVFEWSGWDAPPDPHGMAGLGSGRAYFGSRKPDKWDRAELLRVDYLELRQMLGMAEDQKYISPWNLSGAKVREPHSGKETTFAAWAEQLAQTKDQGLTTLEKKALELADHYWSYQQHRMGQRLMVIPVQDSPMHGWASVADLVQVPFDAATDPTGQIRKAQEHLREARAAYLKRSPEAFNRASAGFLAAVKTLGTQVKTYPLQSTVDWEVAYNHWVPFRFAWVLMLITAVALLLGMGSRWKLFYVGALGAYAAGLAAMLIGFGMRVAISGRAPVTNMYESVIYVGMGVAAIGLAFELLYRNRAVFCAAASVAAIALLLADNCPAHLDPSLQPLQPVLRSNFWLVTHVLTITLSYAAFALALGIGDVTLGYFLFRSQNHQAIATLSQFTYRALQVGVLLLAAGTILGGVWADYAWGRFWGWDPKEVWALIALLGYLAVLHARYVNWVGHFGLAASAVVWYGVNFVLGAGLHSYGFGGGGQGYVAGAILAQFLYVGLAGLRSPVARSAGSQPPLVPARGTNGKAKAAVSSIAETV